MPRWGMVVDLGKCIGCGTCTTACDQSNGSPPGADWRRLITRNEPVESGDWKYLTMACVHCSDPPCLEVCPTTATHKRQDGIVDINYDLCIGCGYCVVACPYLARTITSADRYRPDRDAGLSQQLASEEDAIGVPSKCNFCRSRVDAGTTQGLHPGVDRAATPACVNSCIADALYFGDLDDPESRVSRAVQGGKAATLQRELGTGASVYYLTKDA